MPFLATRSYNSSGAAEVAAKSVASWSNASGIIDAPNDDQCGMFDVGAPNCGQREPFGAPNDNQCTPNESVVALPEAFKLTDPVCVHTFLLTPSLTLLHLNQTLSSTLPFTLAFHTM